MPTDTPPLAEQTPKREPLRAIVMTCLAALLLLFGLDMALTALAAIHNLANAGGLPDQPRLPWHWLLLQEWLVGVAPYLAGVILPLTIIFLRTAGLSLLALATLSITSKLIRRQPLRFATGELFLVLLLALAAAGAFTAWRYFAGAKAAQPARKTNGRETASAAEEWRDEFGRVRQT